MQSLSEIGMSVRLENAAVSYMAYLAHAMWPSGLAAYYPHPFGSLPGWKVGLALGRGEELERVIGGMNEVAEGVRTTSAACALAERTGVEMPIARDVQRVLDGEAEPAEVVAELMNRQLRNENE